MDQFATTSTNTLAPFAIAPGNDPDCERVNTVLDQLIEGQPVTAEDEDYLYDHASDCSPCFNGLKKQQLFIGFLNQRVSRHPSPVSLHGSILARVGAETA